MERDFMGLNFKVKVKEEEQVDQSSQNSGFLAMSSSGGCNLGNNLQPDQNQTVQSSSIPHEDKMHQHAMYNPSIIKAHFPKQNPIIEAHYSRQNSHTATPFSKQNFANSFMKPPVSGRIPAMNSPPVVPSNAFVAGVTGPRHTSEPPGAPAELTIFYAGRVNVYNNISPEKAQTIMFMAANGCTASDRLPPDVRVQASAPNDVFANKIIETTLCSAISSPMSGCNSNGNPQASVPLPQARKASLARFLEKRKERIMSSSPYLRVNKSGEGTGESNAGSSATSGVDSSSMSMEKDVNL